MIEAIFTIDVAFRTTGFSHNMTLTIHDVFISIKINLLLNDELFQDRDPSGYHEGEGSSFRRLFL